MSSTAAARLAYGDHVRGRLYLHAEQGAGDAIMMARYIPLIRPHVDTLTVDVMKGLAPLFRAVLAESFPDVAVVARGEAPIDPEGHDYHLPMMSCPAIFGTTLQTVPKPLDFRPLDAGSRSIPVESGRIGLCWRGSTTHTNDRVRSMPFEACFPLLDLAASHGFTFQSLQFGYEVSPPLDACPLGDFLDTARQIARCEAVVSCDTSIAHLAASMGVRTLICLPFVAEWRWLEFRDDSPWYPSARLIRQTTAGDWPKVIDRVVEKLTAVHSLEGSPMVQI